MCGRDFVATVWASLWYETCAALTLGAGQHERRIVITGCYRTAADRDSATATVLKQWFVRAVVDFNEMIRTPRVAEVVKTFGKG